MYFEKFTNGIFPFWDFLIFISAPVVDFIDSHKDSKCHFVVAKNVDDVISVKIP